MRKLAVYRVCIYDPSFLLPMLAPVIRFPPPQMRLIYRTSTSNTPRNRLNKIMPRLPRKNIMHNPNLLIPPDIPMHTPPPQRLKRIIHVRQRNPPPPKHIREQLLIWEVILR